MNWTWPDVHSIVTVIGALAVTAFVFLHPGTLTLEDIALAYLTINGGQSIGALGQGGKRWMQGGSMAPDTIITPITTKETGSPLAPTPTGEK